MSRCRTLLSRAGYHWLLEKDDARKSPGASKCMGLEIACPENIRFFIWFICHDCLDSTEGMFTSKACQRCNSHDETILHCMRDCHSSQLLWKDVPSCR
ncbi:hypothetical protein L6164_019302 [Bauhinia variegata]|uniref:Uncharacterized protein n=1 Tax=Bauhinia variegata TaxID=167791 RepID=A0ACB9NF47_BAUVA|nr:hypothetical protein L6164_019302 [Bauhinia variegata]